MEYDFIVGFTLFTPKGFKTMYRHFDKLDTAKMFVSNVNIKDNRVKQLEDVLHRWCSEERDEEFEL